MTSNAQQHTPGGYSTRGVLHGRLGDNREYAKTKVPLRRV